MKIKTKSVILTLKRLLIIILITGLAVTPMPFQIFAEDGDNSITDFAGLTQAIIDFNSGSTDKTLNIGADFDITSRLTIDCTADKTLTIQSVPGQNYTLKRDSNFTDNLFCVESGTGLIFQNITIDGNNVSNSSSLVFVNGTFTMNNGAILKNNKATNGFGSGVYVCSQGTFIMNDGEISGNDASNGGGVYVTTDGSFVMNGGNIKNNIASAGGGVVVNDDASFIMTGGKITENTGGVLFLAGTFIVGGTAKVTDNTSYGSTNNVDISYSMPEALTFGTGTESGGNGCPAPVTIGDNKMQIGVTVDSDRTFTVADANAASYLSCFTADAANRVVAYQAEGKLKLAAVYTVTLTINKNGLGWTGHGKTYSLRTSGGSTYSGTANGAAVTFTVPDAVVTYTIYDGDDSTGKTIAVNASDTSETLNYYTVSFSESTAGVDTTGAAISATYDDVEITSDDVVLSGKKLIITAAGSGAGGYLYTWSGTGIDSADASKVFERTINTLSGAVDASCLITGHKINVTVSGLDDLKVGQPLPSGAKAIYTLSGGTYADPITANDFAINPPTGSGPRPAWMTVGPAVRISGTVVEVPISGTPTAVAEAIIYTQSASIPGRNITGEVGIVPTGSIPMSAVVKGDGAAVSGTPTLDTKTSTSITVNTVTYAGSSGQSVEYGYSTSSSVTPTSWQSGVTFSVLDVNTDYYIFARTAANTNYNAGAAQMSAAIKTYANPAAAVTISGLNSLKVGQTVSDAKIIYTLSGSKYEASITAGDFTVLNLPTGLTAGTANRVSDTVVEVPITGAPTTYNSSLATLGYTTNIPAANIVNAMGDVTVTGVITASAVARADVITVNITGLTKEDVTYDGNTHIGVTGSASSGAYGGILVYEYTGTGIVGKTTTAPKNAGSYTLTVSVPSDNEDYTGSETYNFKIEKAVLTITGFNIAKVYDGSNSVASFGDLTFSGLVGSETSIVDAQATAAYNNADAGTGKAIVFTGSFEMALGTAKEGNYTITQPTGITGTISGRDIANVTLNITGSKTYTGSQLKPGFSVNDTLTITSDDYEVSYGTNISIGVNNGSITLTGKRNYAGTKTVYFDIENDPGKILSTVTVNAPADITYGETLDNPTASSADGTEFVYNYSGILSDESGTVYNSDVKPTQPGSYSVTATLVSSTHSGSDSASFIINKKALTWAANGRAGGKTYDGTAAAAELVAPTLVGIVSGDNVDIVKGTLNFKSAEVGTAIAVTATGYGISGVDAWKYSAPAEQPNFGTADITAKNNPETNNNGNYYPTPPIIEIAKVAVPVLDGLEKYVTVSANMKNAFSYSVEIRITDDNKTDEAFAAVLGTENNQYISFDISLFIKGTDTRVQPKEGYPVTIGVPLPQDLWETRDNVQIGYISNGELTILPSKLVWEDEMWKIVFETDHFSPYALLVDVTLPQDNEPEATTAPPSSEELVAPSEVVTEMPEEPKNNGITAETTTPNDEATENKDSATSNPHTGDINKNIIWMLIVFVVGGLTLVIGKASKKRNPDNKK